MKACHDSPQHRDEQWPDQEGNLKAEVKQHSRPGDVLSGQIGVQRPNCASFSWAKKVSWLMNLCSGAMCLAFENPLWIDCLTATPINNPDYNDGDKHRKNYQAGDDLPEVIEITLAILFPQFPTSLASATPV
jgi:hypothetical protein